MGCGCKIAEGSPVGAYVDHGECQFAQLSAERDALKAHRCEADATKFVHRAEFDAVRQENVALKAEVAAALVDDDDGTAHASLKDLRDRYDGLCKDNWEYYQTMTKLKANHETLKAQAQALREASSRLYRLVNNSILGVGTNAAENAEFRGSLIMACGELKAALERVAGG